MNKVSEEKRAMLKGLRKVFHVFDGVTEVIFNIFMLPVYPLAKPVAVWANNGHSDTARFFRTMALLPIYGTYLFLVFLVIDRFWGLPNIFIW